MDFSPLSIAYKLHDLALISYVFGFFLVTYKMGTVTLAFAITLGKN